MSLRAYKFLLLFGDVLCLYFSLWLMLLLRFWQVWDLQIFWSHASVFFFLYPFWLVIFYLFDLYDLSVHPRSHRFPVLLLGSLVSALFLGVLFFYIIPSPSITPKTNLVIYIFLLGGLMGVWRWIFFSLHRSRVFWRVGLFATDVHTPALQKAIHRFSHLGYQTVLLSSDSDLQTVLHTHKLNVCILPESIRSDPARLQALYACLGHGLIFFDPVSAYEFFSLRIPVTAIDHYWFLKNTRDHKTELWQAGKRLFDLVVASFLLLLSVPVWLLVFLATSIGGGPMFYRQTRVGKNGQCFEILKFRTMRVDAETQGVQWAQKNDPRVTRLGAWLRATHIDELPQLVNVIRGDISLVGPRPERPEFVAMLAKEIPHYHLRLLVKPGFTGWAQIRFRYARSITDSLTKFEYDLYYIKNRSFVLDLLILIKTVQLLFRREV